MERTIPTSEDVEARLTWDNPDQARIEVGFGADGAAQASEGVRSQVVAFGPGDEPVERYRALGFTIGSLAGTLLQAGEVAPVAQTEPEQSLAAPRESTEVQPRKVEEVPPDPVTPFEYPPGPPLVWDGWLELGAGLGAGFRRLRGAGFVGLAAGTPGWLAGIQGAYGRQPKVPLEFESVEDASVGLETWDADVRIGPRFGQFIRGAVFVGGGARYVRMSSQTTSVTRGIWVPFGQLGVSVRVMTRYVNPLFKVRLLEGRSVPVEFASTSAGEFSGTQFEGYLGIAVPLTAP